jgi:hypothetical protein
MDNVEDCGSYINKPLSQKYISYLSAIFEINCFLLANVLKVFKLNFVSKKAYSGIRRLIYNAYI